MDADYDQIAPGLYMGSHPRKIFCDVWIPCAEELQPSTAMVAHLSRAGVEVLPCPLRDDGRTPLSRSELVSVADTLALAVPYLALSQQEVLVTCAQGRNRSGFVTAMMLKLAGHCDTVEEAIWIVRERRSSPYGAALSNSGFVRQLLAAERKGHF